jgi:lysophospholipase L1-like esterase
MGRERLRRIGLLGTVIVLAAWLSGPVSAAGPPQPALYLALGDSVAAGIGASQPTQNGYVALVYDMLTGARHCGRGEALGCRLDLLNLAVPGATTTTLIGRPGQASQLAEAVAQLEARAGSPTPVDDVRLVTLTIGGNDLYWPVLEACAGSPAAEACRTTIARQLRLVAANYDVILPALREAAGDSTTIAVMTYYNPLPACQFAFLADLAGQVLEGGGGIPHGLNDIIREAAARHGALVAETLRIIGTEDLVGGPDCLHPDDSGHADIAAAFAAAVTADVGGPPGRP